MCEHLSIVFSNECQHINNHLFGKAIEWAQQNPDDEIIWIRKKSINQIPKVDVDWSSKIHELKRIRFLYNSKNITGICMKTAMDDKIHDDVAAIIVSIDISIKSSNFGAMLASLSHFCNQNVARAAVHINYDIEKEENVDDINNSWENQEMFEKSEGSIERNDQNDEENRVEKLKMIATLYSTNIFLIKNGKFQKCE